MKSAQTYLTDKQFEALARIETALKIEPGKGRPSETPAHNVKKALALCVEVTDWILMTGIPLPERFVGGNHD